MWTRSKQHKRRKEMVRTRKKNLNLLHQEEINEGKFNSCVLEVFSKALKLLGHRFKANLQEARFVHL
jgi:hypothetical protein